MTSTAPQTALDSESEMELQLLRRQNNDLQSQLDKLRLQIRQTEEPQSSGLHHRHINHSNSSVGESVDENVKRAKSLLPRQSSQADTNCPKTPKKVQMEVPEPNGFTTPKSSNKKQPLPKDGGGKYTEVLHMDEEHGINSQESYESTEDEGDELIHDDSSHNKHQNRRFRTRSRYNVETFGQQIRDRGGWLIGLLFLQSCSSFIIQHNERFLQNHMVIVQFLTMLVGAGGNAGNQASVRVIRGLAVGSLNDRTIKQFLTQEIKMAFSLSALLGLTGFIRAALFRTPPGETIAVVASLCAIVAISVGIGSTLPLAMKRVGIDPAHSSTTIQVVMDIMGVLITVCVSSVVMSFKVFQHDEHTDNGNETVS